MSLKMKIRLVNNGKKMLNPIAQITEVSDKTQRKYANQFKTIWREKLSHSGSGRVYTSMKMDGSKHTASAPGQPPAPDTGEMRNSIRIVAKKGKTQVIGGGDSKRPRRNSKLSTGEIMKVLEYGSPGNNLEPRPHLKPALAEFKEKLASRGKGKRGLK